MGYCPFSSFRSRYNRLYRDTGQLGAHSQNTIRPDKQAGVHSKALRHGTATRATRLACAQGRAAAYVCVLAIVVSRYNFCIVVGGDLLCRDTTQQPAHDIA